MDDPEWSKLEKYKRFALDGGESDDAKEKDDPRQHAALTRSTKPGPGHDGRKAEGRHSWSTGLPHLWAKNAAATGRKTQLVA